MSDGRKGRYIGASPHDNHYVEPYAVRKARRDLERKRLAALAADQGAVKSRGRPKELVPGTPKGNRFVQLWNDGTQIKIIAHELGVSEKTVKNARPVFKLKTRRPNLGNGQQFRLALDTKHMKWIRIGATRRGSSKADYIRELIRRDAELKSF